MHFTVYATIIQCRSALPDEVGAVCWLALDNVASSIYVPFYASITDFPETYKTDGRVTGFSNKSAWWAFNRLGTITAKRWGDMHILVDNTWNPIQKEFFDNQNGIERAALDYLNQGERAVAIDFLTLYSIKCGNRAVNKAWSTADLIWTTFDGLW